MIRQKRINKIVNYIFRTYTEKEVKPLNHSARRFLCVIL